MNTPSAAWWLAFGILRRLLREGMVLRSLLFPGALAIGATLATVLIMLVLQPQRQLGVTAAARTTTVEAMAAEEMIELVDVVDPAAALDAGEIAIVLDVDRLHVLVSGQQPLHAERLARRVLGSAWLPLPSEPRGDDSRTDKTRGDDIGKRIMIRIISILFAMYGVVFGAGGAARDRAEGTLDAELVLGIPTWTHGLVRLFVGSGLLGGFMISTMLIFAATVGISDPWNSALQGVLAGSAGTAIGLIAVGGATLDRGFATALSLGLSTVLGTLAVAFFLPSVAAYIPIASLWSGASFLNALPLSCVLGAAAIVSFAKRTAVA